MQPIQGERRRRAGQKHRLCAAADTAGVRGGLSTHYAAFIYDAVHAKTGETTGKGVFTIVEVKAGQGASAGWGRLKSGAGWISLDYATRLA